MALGILAIMFIIIALITVLGVALLYLIKKPEAKNIIFYFLSGWGIFIAFINATSLPSNYILEQALAWGSGFLSIIALIIKIKRPEKSSLSYMLVSSSSLLGLIDLLFF